VSAAIEVAWIDLEKDADSLSALESLLDDAERARVASRATSQLRRRATVSLASRRLLAADVLDVMPGDVTLAAGADGRRSAAARGAAPVAISVSTCGETGIAAVARHGAVGVDVEDLGEVPEGETFMALVATPSERRTLETLDVAARRRALLVLWTRKEAYLKATGEGIGSRLASLDVPLSAGLHGAPWRPDGDVTWFLFDLDCPRPGLAGTLTTDAARADGAGRLVAPTMRVRNL
jgi:4'-phosphopantetheinyl transferase